MRRLRSSALILLTVLVTLVLADPALAVTHGGEGLYGATDDVVITNTMFFLIALFPTLIVVFSVLQHFWEKRKHRVEAAHAAAEPPARAGW